MQDTSSDIRNVLAYLRDMANYCRKKHRQDLEWDYEEAVDIINSKMFGPLPPRAEKVGSAEYQPNHPPVALAPAGAAFSQRKNPLRKVVLRASRPYRTWHVTYEVLECGHEFLPLVGETSLAKRRRCTACGREVPAKKKPTGVAVAKAKAVSA